MTAAVIHLTFTSNFPSGTYRGGYRIGSTGPYTPISIFSCPCAPAPCSTTCVVDISIMVEHESCEKVRYEGWIQPTCQEAPTSNPPVGTEPGIKFWSVEFEPKPACKAWELKCVCTEIENLLTITDPGDAYDPTLSPINLLTDPGFIKTGGGTHGTITSALMYIGNGGIATFNITNGGTGYLVDGNPSGIAYDIEFNTISGSGSNFKGDVTVTSGVITAITIKTPGNGYTIGSVIEPITDTHLTHPSGTTATIEVVTLNTNKVEKIDLRTTGCFTNTLAFTLPSPTLGGGHTATCEPVFKYCHGFNNAGGNSIQDCKNNTIQVDNNTFINKGNYDYIVTCSKTKPQPQTNYINEWNINEASYNCLCECSNYTVTNDRDDSIIIYYFEYGTGELKTINLSSKDNVTFNAVTGAVLWSNYPQGNVTIVRNGGCTT